MAIDPSSVIARSIAPKQSHGSNVLRAFAFADANSGAQAARFAERLARHLASCGPKVIVISSGGNGCMRSIADISGKARSLSGEALAGYLASGRNGFGTLSTEGRVLGADELARLSVIYDLAVIAAGADSSSPLLACVSSVPCAVVMGDNTAGEVRSASSFIEKCLAGANGYHPAGFVLPEMQKHLGGRLAKLFSVPSWGVSENLARIAERAAEKAVPVALSHGAASERTSAVAREILEELRTGDEFKGVNVGAGKTAKEELQKSVESAVRRIAGSLSSGEAGACDLNEVVAKVVDEAVGLGPLEPLLADASVTEVMVNGHDSVFIERNGAIENSDVRFEDDAHLRRVIERVVADVGRRVDESSPMVDARLSDGSRINAVIPPLAVDGPCLTIRRFVKRPQSFGELVALGMLTKCAAEFLSACVRLRASVVVSGGTGSGKTTLLGVLASAIGDGERVITIEDAAELKLACRHVVRLEARPPNIEGAGAVSIRDLVKNALRMRPTRIVVGECRGAEAIDMLQAMNTGHEGSLTTVHANSPRDALSRLETMVLMGGAELPLQAVREQISRAVDLVVQVARVDGGARRVVEIAEVTSMEGAVICMQALAKANVSGGFMLKPTGLAPLFAEKRGVKLQRMEG